MVEMSQEQRFQVLGGSTSQRNESDHIAAQTIPVTVVIPDTGPGDMHPETGHLSLRANNASEEQSVKRKRGRPRKIKSEDQHESGPERDASSPDQFMKRGRLDRVKQTTKGGGRDGVLPLLGTGESSVPVKKGRGRPKKVTMPTEGQLGLQPQLTTQPSGSQTVSSVGVASHTSTSIYNAVQQLAQDAAIVSAIHGTPVQVLPTTAVASMNIIDSSNSPLVLRPAAPVSVLVSPTRDDATEWTTTARVTTPPSKTANESVSPERRGYGGMSLMYSLQGASTPPLLHAEQPKVLKLLPQCTLSLGEVSVKLVDRLAETEESDGQGAGEVEEVRHDTRYLKQHGELDVNEAERYKRIIENTTGSSQVIVSIEPDPETQAQLMEVKPQPPDQAPLKRKRGRPPKSRNPDVPQPSTKTQEEPVNKKDAGSSMPSGESMGKAELSVSAAVSATDQPVTKRKLGRPPKVKTQNTLSESASLPPQATTTMSRNGEENKPSTPRRGRPPKSTKTKIQTAEANGEVKVKRGRGRPRKYPIPAVAASGPFLPSVSGVTLPATSQSEEVPPTHGVAHLTQIKSKQQSGQGDSSSQDSQATVAVKRKRGRPPKHPDGPPPAKRKPGRPRIHPIDLSSPKRGHPPKTNPQPLDLSPRKRGRPPKMIPKSLDQSPRKRGRPPKTNPKPLDQSPRKRGRPPKTNSEPPALSPRKRGRPRKHPLPDEEAVPPRKPGRPKKNPLPDENEAADSSQNEQEQQEDQQVEMKPDRQTKEAKEATPEVTQKETSPIIEVEKAREPLSKRKRGRPKKIPSVVATPLQEPTLSLSADESTASLPLSGPEKADNDSSVEVEKLSLQISFSDSDSEHSEKREVQSSAIMALANRVVAPSPSPPRQLDSPLLDPSFEESYDEDSDPETK